MTTNAQHSANSDYIDFLKSKISIASKDGFEIDRADVNPILKPHQVDVVQWAILGGRRAGFLSFGLGKTVIQLETLRLIHKHKGGNHLVVCPLGVKQEFSKDSDLLGIDRPTYITNTDQISKGWLYITNYERIRKGDIDPSKFTSVTFDEASVLRGLETQTVDMLMREFRKIPYRFVFTATPSPNRFLELTNYAHYLGIMDRGQILTRFFERDSTKAGNLNLLRRREKEFWYWMSSWACFVTKPSDLGYSDEGYQLPPLKITRHLVTFDRGIVVDKRDGQTQLFANAAGSLIEGSREKRRSLTHRIEKAAEIITEDPDSHYLIWHHLNDEAKAISEAVGDNDLRTVTGSQSIDQKEELLIGFSSGEYKYLSTKPKIAGSGCNFQHHCHKAIFVGIDYKFNDFIQAVHRIYRFMQKHQCEIHIIYTDAETEVLEKLEEKWSNHLKLQSEMTEIIKKHGLNSDLYQQELSREMFENRQEYEGDNFKAINNDNVLELDHFQENSVDLIVTSIPFGNHYEYSENYNCFGHNVSNEDFFAQMEFLTPKLYRALKPGRIAAIHVKDRIRYSSMTGSGSTFIDPFSDHTNLHFIKHGFLCIGRITVTTDVVQENNQTYRLGWSEKCKDGTKMGVGLPEYILLFRKAPTDKSNTYADQPVTHSKEDYTRARWQIDAHSYWKSDGERLVSSEMLAKYDLSQVLKIWKALQANEDYDYEKHIDLCEKLDAMGKLPTKYMALPPMSKSDHVWDDVVRMKTLNSTQARKNLSKHICPLQLDLIERLIERYSNPGEIVLDPFGGIMSVPYMALQMDRKGVGIELNDEYWADGVSHLRSLEMKMKSASIKLFDAAPGPTSDTDSAAVAGPTS